MMKFVETLVLKTILALTIIHSFQECKHVIDYNRMISAKVIKNAYNKSTNKEKYSNKDLSLKIKSIIMFVQIYAHFHS